MPVSNLNNAHLKPAEVQAINNALTALETALQPLTVNLTPDERKRYGRVNEQNKLLVNKVHDYYTNSPQLGRPDVNWPEFSADYQSRQNLESFLNRLNALRARLTDAKVLHDFDNYSAALEDYGYASFMAQSNTPGYQDKYAEMKQFFTRRAAGTNAAEEPGSGDSASENTPVNGG